MKVFLSHSSKDKGFVEAVAGLLKPGTFELDSQTFDAGLVNSESIVKALRRCDLFCLFLSENSVNSTYVDFETLLGIELLASGNIGRFLTICLEDTAFAKASENVKFFNVVRKSLEVESTARLIQGSLISAAQLSATIAHPFMGREDEMVELERQVTDHKRPSPKALFISGNFGAGRRTIGQKFYQHQYPNVGRIIPSINIEQFAGLEELYRKILTTLRPTMTAPELRTRIQAYEIAPREEQQRLTAQLLNSLLVAGEAAFLVDKGGLLTDAGSLEPEFNEVVSHLEARPHPPAIVVAPRMIPRSRRRPEDDICYLALKSLVRESTERLISRLLKDKSIAVTDESLDELVKLSDGHPFNIYRMVDELSERGLEPFLANPRDFIDWKHRHSSEYLKRINLGDEDVLILGLLKLVPELDFTAVVSALEVDAEAASEALQRLTDQHVVEASADRFVISPPLRVAVERDKRIRLGKDLQKSALRSLAQSLSIRLEEGTAPIALVDSAVLASLENGGDLPSFASVFLLPSHYVWLAKRNYDQRYWEESIRFAKEALKSTHKRLSPGGFVAACRYMCLSAARTGDTDTFEEGITKLKSTAKDDWARSNTAFLEGFNLRMKGNLPAAEESCRRSYELSPGNQSAARELASICLARGNLHEAEQFAREAHSRARSNPYLIDSLISVLIRRHGRSAKHMSEINDLFDMLANFGEEAGRSFFTTRKAEFEHLWGNNKEALRLSEQAVSKTPNIFEPRRIYAKALLKDGNKLKARDQIDTMHGMVNARIPSERRSNYRPYLETYAEYLTEVGSYQDAKNIYDDHSIFTEDERIAAIRNIEIVQGFRGNK